MILNDCTCMYELKVRVIALKNHSEYSGTQNLLKYEKKLHEKCPNFWALAAAAATKGEKNFFWVHKGEEGKTWRVLALGQIQRNWSLDFKPLLIFEEER